MIPFGYDEVARFCMVGSLFLFIALFIVVIFYAVRFAKTETTDRVQRNALDLVTQGDTP